MSDSGHPTRHGYVKCDWCKRWRRVDGLSFGLVPLCAERQQCEQAAAEAGLYGGIPRGPALNVGWDANGAPTGVDENGDAA